jgi:hypothetical protein
MTTFRAARLTGAVALILTLAFISTGVAAAGGGEGGRKLRDVREATARFRNVNVAIAAGYGEFRDAKGIACIDNPLGGMGIHYVNLNLVLDNPPGSPSTVDPLKPEAFVYEPRDGKLKLVALEYIVFQEAWNAEHASPPSLFGHEFEPIAEGNRYGIPAFYELHVWLWKHNPRGMFQDWNPRVSCTRASDGDDD